MSLVSDLRLSCRALFKQPTLTVIAVVALTLGIGLTTIMFSIIHGAFWRGLPFEESDRIAAVGSIDTSDADSDAGDWPQYDFGQWVDTQQSFEDFGAFYQGTVNISDGNGNAERFDGVFTTAGLLAVPRTPPSLGRLLQPSDEAPGAPTVILLGHAVWKNRYQGDPEIIGREIRVNGQLSTVIGVMPEGYEFPTAGALWVPLTLSTDTLARTTTTTVTPVGRLKPGVTLAEATAEFEVLASRLATEFPETNRTVIASVVPFIDRFLGPEVLTMLLTMLGAVFGVLLIACANVANLLIARTAVRTKEIAIRSALGASRIQVIRQLLSESAVLAVAGAVGGLGLAWAGIGLFNRSIVDTDPPFWIDIGLHPPVLLFVTALALVSTIAAGLLPALQASRADVNDVLKDETRGASGLRVGRLSRTLVVVEIALSCGLLVASGLAIKSIAKLKNTDRGFASASVFTARLGLFEADYPTPDARARFFANLQARLDTIPGALGATLATSLPATGSSNPAIVIDGVTYATDEDHPDARTTAISPGFFKTFDRQLLSGRAFRDTDNFDAPRVAIVNESFAKKFFEGADPIGRRFRPSDSEPDTWTTVVGLAPDMYLGRLEDEDPAGFYLPLAQNPPRFASVAVRATGAPMELASPVRREIRAVDADLPIYWVRTMEEYIAQDNWHYQVFGTLFTAFGAAALFLATIGLYGVMSFSVTTRLQEIGVRRALGASGGQVMRMVLRQGLWQIGIGLTIGIGLAAGLSQMLTLIMFEVDPFDTAVFVTVVSTLFAVALIACLIPARRALRVHPTVALRA